jgi:hypothetical protein
LVKAGHKAVCTDAKCKAPSYPILMPAVLTLCTCGGGGCVHAERS